MTLTDIRESRHSRALEDTMSKIAQALADFQDTLLTTPPEQARGATPDQALVDALLDPVPSLDEIGERALDARWPVPDQVAAVAFDHLPRRVVLPSGILVGRHGGGTVALIPDPSGPARRAVLTSAFAGHSAAVGLPVPLVEAADSLRWARQALTLKVDEPGPVFAEDHLALLVLAQDPRLMAHAIARTLKPLLSIRAPQRIGMATTLVACFEHGFNATAIGERLHLHPQTVRYRLRSLERLFGDRLTDPAQRLELHMLLTHWLSTQTPNETLC
ncbi:PucR family transcriptional regulator [Actinomadura rupiterrae]|uniref:PucR family transcriptional regulator n=1 Tax=Actinomadura rupiterrae TaxID=559627 RepID=UPI0020A3815B|nr:helix-turn-helix domain-containing protein [Actinomadura rupiterrae]MCP2342124.1 hypothetical protein [Actinomadura rupiterrae]